MKKNYSMFITAMIAVMMFATQMKAQELLFDDFETNTRTWETVGCYFDIRNNDYPDSNASTGMKVLFTNRGTGNDNWSGAICRLAADAKITGYNYAHLKMYRNNTNLPNLKVSENPSMDIAPLSGVVANQWQDVVFDISQYKTSGIEFIMIMVDRTTPLLAEAFLLVDDVVLSNDPTPRLTVELPEYKPVLSEFCDKEVTHMNIAAETASKIRLTISNPDGLGLKVIVTAVDANDPIDFLQVKGIDVPLKNPEGDYSLEYTIVGGADGNGNVTFDLMWSKKNMPGNWMVRDITVPYKSSCNVEVTDTEEPKMTSATVSGTPTFNSVDLVLLATDNETSPVTKFIANDSENGIINMALSTDATGNVTISGLKAATTYNLTITAKDNMGLISQNSVLVSFTTANRSSECSGDRGHFAPADAVKRIHYEISYHEGTVTYTMKPLNETDAINFANIQIDGTGYDMTIASDKKSATYSMTDQVGNTHYILFVYSVGSMPGNEMTAENASAANAIYYKTGECDGIISGIRDHATPNLLIYPNPAKENIYIDAHAPIAKVMVHDMGGRMVRTLYTSTSQVVIPDLAAGYYIITVVLQNGAVITRNVIKL